ncbi:MAG: iron-sulfur cluster assembly scaffold protein [Acidobacteria bacterium]|nr:iron-sulfur cluster assembly scaffold protein [Acidobacteriota bacterium]
MLYPEEISRLAFAPRNARRLDAANSNGADASFVCGAFVRFALEIDVESKEIGDIRFQSNGCGFMIAAADVLAETIRGTSLLALHGTETTREMVESAIGEFPETRVHCLNTVLNSLRNALADFRRRQLEGFVGEKALVCTCFGVTEETVESCGATSVEEAGEITNAGTGCGSCRMLIEEIIASAGSDL